MLAAVAAAAAAAATVVLVVVVTASVLAAQGLHWLTMGAVKPCPETSEAKECNS